MTMSNLNYFRFFRIPFLAFSIAALMLSGCTAGGSDGAEKHKISGTVTFEDTAVQEGNVTFYNDKSSASGQLDTSGAFEIVGGLPAGKYKVSITPVDISEAPSFGMDKGKTVVAKPKDVANIPQKYRSAGTTPLEETVKSGDNNFKLNMTEG
jgi:hypothetical protein